ncbi:carnitine O-palmitoyltransferase 1, liver isoform [Aplysia californica]|uniref:Carnitine O-palmitoyltransferase 1, liver isoform n=1 Tax=Aplysia californica TaxID=6500 RepID=A0ABM1A9E9_APLCA|nr:carnitine O-palmitoyltransferase 1, liver isoform [Aplysia californica]
MTNQVEAPTPRPRYAWPRPASQSSRHGSGWMSRLWRNAPVYRARLNNYLWPGSLTSLGLCVGGAAAVRGYDLDVLDPVKARLMSLEEAFAPLGDVPAMVCSCCLSGMALFVLSVALRRCSLRLLLAYRGWMYENKPSLSTKLWGLLVYSMSGWKPSLYNCQSSLPRLPVPPLATAIQQLMESFEPLYQDDPKTLEELKREAEKFVTGVGPKLQRALVLRSWWTENFVSDWWEKYVYLMGRSPLPINSNYYIMDQSYWSPTTKQCARAAGVVYQLLLVWEQILSEDLEPLRIRGTVPVCMAQYRRTFSTTRVPGEEMDELVHYPTSEAQHVIVNRRGLLYKMDVTDINGRLVSPTALESQLEWIVQDADARYSQVPESERLVPALTATDRSDWARARTEFFSQGVNKDTLKWVESAVLHIVLDTHSYDDLSSRATHLLHGKTGTYWFDKSIEVVVMTDGHFGLNCEHSLGDAPVIGHIQEFNLTYDVIKKYYSEEGHATDPPLTKPTQPSELRSKPTPLQWEVGTALAAAINRAYSQADKNNSDLDLVLFDHDTFGKGAIKKCRLSPDAFIQMALHTTYRKLHGRSALTYEASMTRLYKAGRTETVRSLTSEAKQFVETFLDAEKPEEEKRALLKAACERHAKMYKDAMNGKGIDRHLFALYVASRGLGIDCEFLKRVLSIPWTLSTSQQPQQQIEWSPTCSNPKFRDQVCPGGGFGPVSDDGYGVSYMVAGEHRVFFHVSSRRSTQATDSAVFVKTLQETMSEMKALYGQ